MTLFRSSTSSTLISTSWVLNTYKYNVDYINATDVVSHFNVNNINTYVVNNDTDSYIYVIFFRQIEVENLFHDGRL